MKQSLHFWTTGEWVTSFARQLFYEEHKEWDYIEKLLLYCMAGTDTPEETLKQYGIDVLAGRRCLVGRTDDGTYALVEDTEHPELAVAYERERALRNEWGDNWPKAMREAKERADLMRESREDAASAMMWESVFKMQRARRNKGCAYGWLAPSGKFYPVEWGDHQKWARDFLRKEVGGRFRDMSDQERNFPGDVLVERGWVLLHNPALGIPVVTNTRRLTKAQREFLYDYYDQLEEYKTAASFLNE